MPQGVHILMSAAEGQVVQAWLRANKGPQEMLRLLKEIAGQSQRAGSRGASSFNRMSEQAGRFAAGILGIGSAFQAAHTAANLMQRELEQMRKVQNDAATETISFGEELSKLRKVVLAPASDVTADEVGERALKIRSPISPAERIRIATSAVSAGSKAEETGRRVDIAMDAIKLLGDQLRNDIPALNEFAKSAVVLSKAFPEKSNQEILLAITQALSAGPAGFENLAEFSKNIIPVIAMSKTQGFSMKDAFANVVGLQTRTQDVEGASVRTTFFNLFQDLTEQLPLEQQRQGQRMIDFLQSKEGSEVRQNLLRSADEGLQKIAREQGISMRQLQDRLDIPGAFTPTTRARARTEFGLIELLQPKGFSEAADQTKAEVEATRRNLLEGQDAIVDFSRRISESAGSLHEFAFNLDTAMASLRHLLDVDQDKAVRGQVVNAIEELLPRLGGTAIGTRLESIQGRVQSAELSAGESISLLISALNRAMRRERTVTPFFGPGMQTRVGQGAVLRDDELSGNQQAIISAIKEGVAALNRIVESQQNSKINPPVDLPTRTPAALLQQP